jgi:hypothetical protein
LRVRVASGNSVRGFFLLQWQIQGSTNEMVGAFWSDNFMT